MDPVTLGMAKADAKKRYIGKPPTKVACTPLTAPNAAGAAGTLNLVQRELLKYPFEVLRWRIGFRNVDLRSTTNLTTPCTITGIWTGAPAYAVTSSSGNRWVGQMTGAGQQVSGPLTVPIDGSRVWSGWIEDSPFAPDIEKVLSWGITSVNTGTGMARGNSTQGVSAAGATNAPNATITGVTVGNNQVYMDVVVEFEYAESIKCGLFIGDSNTITYSATAPAAISGGTAGALPSETWPQIAGAMGGFASINLGVGSSTTANWDDTARAPLSSATDYFDRLWDRIPAGAEIDFAVVSLGTNGLGESTTTFVPRVVAINAKLKAMGVRTIWWTTITPRCWPNGSYDGGSTKVAGYLMADAAVGATTISTSFSPATGSTNLLLVGLGANLEDVQINSVTGSGPYTCTLNAPLVNAHFADETLSQGNERQRRYYNNFLRNLPGGVGLFDFEQALERKPGAFDCDPRYVCGDYLHFYRGASIIKASTVVGAGVQPLFE